MKSDPYWMINRYAGTCSKCKQPINKGSDVFYYPLQRSTLCDLDGCGQQAARDFYSLRQDEDGF